LPTWIGWDPSKLTLTGLTPNYNVNLTLVVIVSDTKGLKITSMFSINNRVVITDLTKLPPEANVLIPDSTYIEGSFIQIYLPLSLFKDP